MRRVIVALLCGLSVGCLGDPISPVGGAPRLTFAQHTLDLAALGDTLLLKVSVSGPAGTLGPRGVQFSSTDPAVIEPLGQSGEVAVVGNGRAWVVAAMTGASADSVLVTVRQRATSIGGIPTTALRLSSLGDTTSLTPVARDANGVEMSGAAFRYSASDTTILSVSPSGVVRALRNGRASVAVAVDSITGSAGVVVRQVAARVAVLPDSVHFATLGRSSQLQVAAWDDGGQQVTAAAFRYSSSDSTVASVTPTGVVAAVRNGQARVTLAIDSIAVSVPVTVIQAAAAVVVTPTVLQFNSLGTEQSFQPTVVDSGGARAWQSDGPVEVLGMSDTTVARVTGATSIRAVSNGSSVYRFVVGGVAGSIAVQVHQVAVATTASGIAQDSILRPTLGSALPVVCTGVDSGGNAVAASEIPARSVNGTVAGPNCASLTVVHSGVDTLVLTSGTTVTKVPMRLAVQPTVSSAAGQFIAMDSIRSNGDLWAPSADTLPGGGYELRIADYIYDSTADENRADLVRLTSQDGVTFAFDTTLVAHGDVLDTLDGRGVENSVIFPAATGGGWRMLYGGGNDYSGWSTYAASSSDRRHWVKTGVAIANGYPGEVNPSGEGLQVDRVANGTWRLINGAYDVTSNGVNTFSITEWVSADQLTWSFVRTLISVLDTPPGATRALYAPCLRQIGPSLWRLVFTGDNWVFQNGQIVSGSSAIWSAVSSDLTHWQQEGRLMGQAGSDLFYSTLAGNRLYVLRRDTGARARVAVAVVTMP